MPVGIAGAYAAWPRRQRLPMPSPFFLPATPRTLAVSVGRALAGRRFAGLPREQLLGELFGVLKQEQEKAERLRRKEV